MLREISAFRPFLTFSFRLPSAPNFEDWNGQSKTILMRIFASSDKSNRKRNFGKFFGDDDDDDELFL